MKVFLAGATGAIGRPLLERLTAAGHEVVATSRDAARAASITRAGVQGVVLDAFDAAAVGRAIAEARPEVVIHQLTSLPRDFSRKALAASFALTGRLRRETVPVFCAAAKEAGARRVVVQSISFVTRPEGPWVQDESAPLWTDAPPDLLGVVKCVEEMERAVADTRGIEGVVLRYGFFYGPGTWYARDGAAGKLISRRQMPIVGKGEGRYSWIHVDDAAEATVRALDRGTPGVYNICDSEPAPCHEWMPIAAAALGARPPLRVPAWLARALAGNAYVHYGTSLRGASSARAVRELGIAPRPWRAGLPAALR